MSKSIWKGCEKDNMVSHSFSSIFPMSFTQYNFTCMWKKMWNVWKGVKIIWKLCEINLLFTHYFTYVSHVCFWVVWCLRTGLTQPLISSSANCTKTQLHTMSRQETTWLTDFVSEFYSDVYKKSFLYKATRYKILQLKLQLVTEVISHTPSNDFFSYFK